MYLQRVVDRGSEGVSVKSVSLWTSAYEDAGGMIASGIKTVVCAAHLLDKGLQWSGAAGKAGAPGHDQPPGDEHAVAGGAAGVAHAPAKQRKGAGGSEPELRGSAGMAVLGGELYRLGSTIRTTTAAHLALLSKGSKRIPQVVITRWGTHTHLGSRLVELWSIIKAVSVGYVGNGLHAHRYNH